MDNLPGVAEPGGSNLINFTVSLSVVALPLFGVFDFLVILRNFAVSVRSARMVATFITMWKSKKVH